MRRCFFHTCIFVTLGVVVNVVLAWSLSFWPTGLREISDFGAVGSHSALQDFFGTDLTFVPSMSGGGSFQATGVEGMYFVGVVTGANPGTYGFDEYTAGWPLLALRGSRREVAGSYEHNGCIPLPAMIRPSSDRPLLFIPTFPGFVINTILYAILLFGLYITFHALSQQRQKRRRMRGLCGGCGYPIGQSSVCTECGETLRKLKSN